jgi:hypothetical protein
MPVGEMLRRMDAYELAEWRAFFALRRDATEKPKGSAVDRLRAMFGNRVKKKE